MTETTIGVHADTKQKFDGAKPDDMTADEFIQSLLNGDTVEARNYVDAEDVLEQLGDGGVDTTDVQEAARKGAADAIQSLQ